MYEKLLQLTKNVCDTCAKRQDCAWIKSLKPEFVLVCVAKEEVKDVKKEVEHDFIYHA